MPKLVRREFFVLFALLVAAMDSPSFAAGPVPVVMASGVLRKCLGIEPGTDKMMYGAATKQYCRQLPANDLYDQAGVRFQAGDHAGAAKIVVRAAEAGNARARLPVRNWCSAKSGAQRYAKGDYWAKVVA